MSYWDWMTGDDSPLRVANWLKPPQDTPAGQAAKHVAGLVGDQLDQVNPVQPIPSDADFASRLKDIDPYSPFQAYQGKPDPSALMKTAGYQTELPPVVKMLAGTTKRFGGALHGTGGYEVNPDTGKVALGNSPKPEDAGSVFMAAGLAEPIHAILRKVGLGEEPLGPGEAAAGAFSSPRMAEAMAEKGDMGQAARPENSWGGARMLAKARQAELAGTHPDDIWRDTGWARQYEPGHELHNPDAAHIQPDQWYTETGTSPRALGDRYALNIGERRSTPPWKAPGEPEAAWEDPGSVFNKFENLPETPQKVYQTQAPKTPADQLGQRLRDTEDSYRSQGLTDAQIATRLESQFGKEVNNGTDLVPDDLRTGRVWWRTSEKTPRAQWNDAAVARLKDKDLMQLSHKDAAQVMARQFGNDYTADSIRKKRKLLGMGSPVDTNQNLALSSRAAGYNFNDAAQEIIRNMTARGANFADIARAVGNETGKSVDRKTVKSWYERNQPSQPQIGEVWGPKFQTLMSGEYKKAVAGGDLSTQYDILSSKLNNATNMTAEEKAGIQKEVDSLKSQLGPEWMKKHGGGGSLFANASDKPGMLGGAFVHEDVPFGDWDNPDSPAPNSSPVSAPNINKGELFDYGMHDSMPVDNPLKLPPIEPYNGRGPTPRIQEMLDNPKVQRRVNSAVGKGLETYPGVAENWYNMEPLREQFHNLYRGDMHPDEAFHQMMKAVGATSPMNPMSSNIANASEIYSRLQRGEPIGNDPTKYPPNFRTLGATTRLAVARKVFGEDEPYAPGKDPPKTTRFSRALAGAAGPEVTVDTHAMRLLAMSSEQPNLMSDYFRYKAPEGHYASYSPRDLYETGQKSLKQMLETPTWWANMPTKGEYASTQIPFQKAAQKFGLAPHQAQAAAWIGAGDKTGLSTLPDRTALQFLEDRINTTAHARGISPMDTLKSVINGKSTLFANKVTAPGVFGSNFAKAAKDLSPEAYRSLFTDDAYHGMYPEGPSATKEITKNGGIRAFDPSRNSWESGIPATWFTDKPEISDRFAGMKNAESDPPTHAHVYPVKINPGGFARANWPDVNRQPTGHFLADGNPITPNWKDYPAEDPQAQELFRQRYQAAGTLNDFMRSYQYLDLSGEQTLKAAVDTLRAKVAGGFQRHDFDSAIALGEKLLASGSKIERETRLSPEYNSWTMSKLLAEHYKAGAPGVIVDHINEFDIPHRQYAVFPSGLPQLRSKFAAFDPAKADSADILSANASGAALAGTQGGKVGRDPKGVVDWLKKLGINTDKEYGVGKK
jgi:hypothetical protein